MAGLVEGSPRSSRMDTASFLSMGFKPISAKVFRRQIAQVPRRWAAIALQAVVEQFPQTHVEVLKPQAARVVPAPCLREPILHARVLGQDCFPIGSWERILAHLGRSVPGKDIVHSSRL